MNAAVVDRWQQAFEGRTAPVDEPSWLAARRASAWEAFRTLGFPTRRDEAWRTIDLAPIVRTTWSPAPAPSDDVLARARVLRDGLAPHTGSRVVLVNGTHVPSLSGDASPPPGLAVRTLADAYDDAERDLGTQVKDEDHAFAALNAALFPDALVIDVAAGTTLEAPLHVVMLSVGADAPLAAHPRMLVRLGANARAAIRLDWAGETPGPFLTNTVAELRLEDGARLELLEVQDLPESAHHVVSLSAHVGRDAVFAGTCLQFGAGLVRADLDTTLASEGAFCRLDGVSLLRGKQHVDVRTNVDHAVPHGSSDQLWKSILDDRASVAFSGRVLVRPGAQKTDAKQANHSLLLSKHAVADSVPQLEIFADDVKCAHGATVGQMDEEALFYLRSRGLGLEQARALLVRAFANSVADRIEDEGLEAHAHRVMDMHLAHEEAP